MSEARPATEAVGGLRESLSIQDQVSAQIYFYRQASNAGDVPAKKRAVDTLADIIWHLLTDAEQQEFNGMKYAEFTAEQFYEQQDIDRIKRFGVTTVIRARKIARLVRDNNRALLDDRCNKSFRLLMRVCQRQGLLFRTKDIETIGGIGGFRFDLEFWKGIVKKKPYDSVILNEMGRNIYEDQRNYLSLFMGKVGSGKSLSAAKLCQLMDPTFSLERVCFDEISLMKLVNSGLPPGSFILADEISSYFGARTAMTAPNIVISRMLQRFRILRLGVAFTCPSAKMADSNLRCMFDMTFSMSKFYSKLRYARATPLRWKFNALDGKGMATYPRKAREGLDATYITDVMFAHPDDGPEGSRGFERRYKAKKMAANADQQVGDLDRLIAYKKEQQRKVDRAVRPAEKTTCKKCEYEWEFSGKTQPRCPRCGHRWRKAS